MVGSNYLSTGFLTLMAGIVVLQSQSCLEEKTPATTVADADVVADLISDVGPLVVIPTIEAFISEMETLQQKVAELETKATNSEDVTQSRTDAQDQWIIAMSVWQQLEVMQVGPAGSSLSFIAGQDIRDEIYSWPTVNPCRIDQKTVGDEWKNDDYFEANLVNAYGLDALEHLLFAGPESICPSQVAPVNDGSWDALGENGVNINRAQFSGKIIDNVITQANSLKNLWAESGGNFSALLDAEAADSPYEDRQQSLNELYRALFYLETRTKDRKLAQPLGLRDCSEDLCIEDVELITSGTAIEAVISNLHGFQTLFTGGEGIGFDDLLVELGHADLSTQILADIEETISLAEEIDQPLGLAIENDYETVMAMYESLSRITTALKLDLAAVLNMEIPQEAAGDND